MRAAAILLLLVGCRSPAGETLAPDEFSLWASNTNSDSSGWSGGQGSPGRRPFIGSGDSETFGFGLTWYLDSTSSAGRHDELLRALNRLAFAEPFQAPVPASAPTPPPTHEHIPVVVPSPEPTPHMGAQDAGRAQAVNQLIFAMIAVATALAGYLGRKRIPYVRDWTSAARAARAEDEQAEDPPEA